MASSCDEDSSDFDGTWKSDFDGATLLISGEGTNWTYTPTNGSADSGTITNAGTTSVTTATAGSYITAGTFTWTKFKSTTTSGGSETTYTL